MGRTSDAREKILTAAQELIELRGFSAVGVAEICTAAGVPKGSFYYFFESKDALALAVIDGAWDAQRSAWSRVLTASDRPIDRIQRLVKTTVRTLRKRQRSCGLVAGCLFGNLALELSNSDSEAVRSRLREIFEIQVEMVKRVIIEAQGAGEATVEDPGAAARSIVAQLEGAIMFAKLYNSIQRLDALWPSCAALLGATQVAGAAA